jgi:Tol biopolymer transport system component
MLLRAGCLLLVLPSLTSAGSDAPLAWSPDGHWLAYTMVARVEPTLPKHGWLYDPDFGMDADGAPADPARLSAVRYRLWATRPDTQVSVLLEESREPLTSPVWRPQGRSLAFGRLVTHDDGRAQFEVVVQDAPGRKQVILSQPCDELARKSADLPAMALAWSPPEGRYLAVPVFRQTLGLAIIRSDNGRVLKVIEDASLPAWSPDGTKLAFVRGAENGSLQCLDSNFGPSRHLANVGRASRAPSWSRDSQTVAIVAHRRPRSGREVALGEPVLVRVPLDGGKPDELPLWSQPETPKTNYRGASFSFNPEDETVFYALDIEAKSALFEVVLFRPRDRQTILRENPITFTVRAGSLATAPNGKMLAVRGGAQGAFSPPGVWELKTLQFTPLAPDDSARAVAITTLIDGARLLLKTSLPAIGQGTARSVRRPTLLPVPGEFASNSESGVRLRRLGRIGRPLCDRPQDAPPADAAVLAFLAEARLFFDYLRGDYAGAFASLKDVDEGAVSADERLRLLSVRAQVLIGLGQFEQAKQAIAFLDTVEPRGTRALEETPAGPVLKEEPAAGEGWAKFLNARVKASQTSNDEDAEADARAQPSDPFDQPRFPQFREEPRFDEKIPGDGDLRLPQQLEPIKPVLPQPAPVSPRRPPPRRAAFPAPPRAPS